MRKLPWAFSAAALALAAVLVAITPTPPASAATFTVGWTTVAGGANDSGNQNGMSATQVTTTNVGGTLTEVALYAVNVNAAPANHGQVAVYTNTAADLPGSLVAKSGSQVLTPNSWNKFPMPAAAVAAGTKYWLVFNVDGAGTQYKLAGSGGRAAWKIPTAFGTWPAQFGTPSLGPDGQRYGITMTWSDAVAPPTTTTSTPPPTTTSTTPPPTSSTTTPPPPGELNLPRVAWEGGPSYYQQFPAFAGRGWTDPNFFPLGVWLQDVISQADVDKDKSVGLNTYIGITDNSDLSLVRSNGMSAMPQTALAGAGAETVSWLVDDEADMNYGPGSDAWNGQDGWNTCIPPQDQGGKCGYTVMTTKSGRLPQDGRPRYANYGKGVQLWETDAEAGKFVNDFQKTVSADMYWYTDPNLNPADLQNWWQINSSNVRRSANYGATVERMRTLDGLDGKRQPIYSFVELGHPFTGNAPTITGPQLQGAVVSSLIHEARGILYFAHSFGGACTSWRLQREACGDPTRPALTDINNKIKQLAPVLNTQSYVWQFNPAVDTMLKRGPDGAYYVFSGLKRDTATGQQTLTLPAGLSAASAQVMFENRSVPITGGKFTDSFAQEYTWHIYKITPA